MKGKVTQLCPTLYNPMDFTVPGILQGRILEWVAIPFSRGISPTEESNPGLLHCRRILYQLSHQGSPRILEWIAHPFSSQFSWPRNWTGVSCIAGRFFTNWAESQRRPDNLALCSREKKKSWDFWRTAWLVEKPPWALDADQPGCWPLFLSVRSCVVCFNLSKMIIIIFIMFSWV